MCQYNDCGVGARYTEICRLLAGIANVCIILLLLHTVTYIEVRQRASSNSTHLHSRFVSLFNNCKNVKPRTKL